MFEVSRIENCKLVPICQFSTLDKAEFYCAIFRGETYIISEIDQDGNYLCDVVKEIYNPLITE